MHKSDIVLIYATFPDAEAAQRIAETLVRERLIACANIFPPHRAIYPWQGKIEIETEVAALFKTRRAQAEAAIARARPLHPSTVPCFLILPIEGGWPAYLDWLRQSV